MKLRGTTRVLAVGSIVLLTLVGCSSNDTAASTCQDLQNLAAQVRGLRDVNIVQTGVDGLQQQVTAVDGAFDQAKASGKDQFGPELDALDNSINELGTTLSGAKDSGKSIGEILSSVESDVSSISSSWNNLTSAVKTELDSCDLSAPAS